MRKRVHANLALGPWQPPGQQMPSGFIPGTRAMAAGGVGANHRAIRETARGRGPLDG